MGPQVLSRSELTTLVLDLKKRVETLEKGAEFPSGEDLAQRFRSLIPEDTEDPAGNTAVSGDKLAPVVPFQPRE